jgi:hypothetical protein
LKKQINPFPLIGKDTLSATTEVGVGIQVQISSLVTERFFGSFDHACGKALAL